MKRLIILIALILAGLLSSGLADTSASIASIPDNEVASSGAEGGNSSSASIVITMTGILEE